MKTEKRRQKPKCESDGRVIEWENFLLGVILEQAEQKR